MSDAAELPDRPPGHPPAPRVMDLFIGRLTMAKSKVAAAQSALEEYRQAVTADPKSAEAQAKQLRDEAAWRAANGSL